MKINNNSFELNEKLSVFIDSSDNDGLIFIPKNIQIMAEVENYYGKITINSINISPLESEFQINKLSIENNIPNLDIKLLDRYIYKVLSDKAGLAYSPYTYFPQYDFTVFEKGRRPSNLDWAMFASLYVFSCNVLPNSIKVELSLAKFLRISEENFKRFMKKIPQELFRKSGHIDSRGGDISLNAENLIKEYLGVDQNIFESNPFLKFYSEVDFA
jgi:hypothetical protein|tara:strand:+ start:23 stop:667 length:645 start_codon:yes stop_codon:yes gene_type:complete